MKKRIAALLLCCVMLLTLSPNLIATAAADDETVPAVEEETPAAATTDETKDEETKDEETTTPEQPAASEEPKAEDPATEEPKDEEPAAEPETKTEEPVESEIVYPTVNYTDVAPFLPPVSGSTMLRAARAAANDTTGDAGEKDSGMKVSKTATANGDGTYTITLEAYATGEQVISEIKEDVPTDIILVLDQSGSMAYNIGQVTYTQYSSSRNSDNYSRRHNGGNANLWYKLADGSYVSVSVTAQETLGYTKITNGQNDNNRNGATNYWANRDNLYTYVNGEVRKVVYTRERDNGLQNWKCTYALEDGTILNQNSEGSRYSPSFQNTDDGYLYLRTVDDAQTVYTYTYTDKDGNVPTIGTSTGASTRPGYEFYRRGVSSSGGGSRLSALKSAVTSFVNAVNEKAKGTDKVLGTNDDIDHRIAVVGFASESGYGDNTELLSIAGSNSGSVGVAYNNITDQNLKDVMQSMKMSAGQTMVTNAINALAAEGATRVDLGLDMANRILNANPVPANEKRNRVVIVFTDGVPTTNTEFNSTVANNAIGYATNIKNSGTTVYSIGIFSGADATSAGNQNGNETQKANWFMQRVSSNTSYPQSPSYYLSAGDADSLNSIFQQISSNITTGGSSTTLDEKTVIKDIISPQFTVPENATDIKVYTAKSVRSTEKWEGKVQFSDANVTIDPDTRTISVTNFSFKDNWCGNEIKDGTVTGFHDGKKLIIEFTVKLRDGFLGGNEVVTNGANSGIYENSSADKPLDVFQQPTVDVPIKDVTVTAENKNVYLLGSVTADELKSGATVKVGDVELKLGEDNYGLEAWQTEYVDITVDVQPTADNLKNLTEDTAYTIKVTVEPKTSGTVTKKDRTGEAKINVFKPVLTFKDSVAYYGDSAPDYSTTNKDGEVWKHGDTDSIGVTMIGDKPELGINYTPEEGKIVAGKINTKQDIPVAVSVKIGGIDGTDVNSYTTFVHQACTGKTCKLPDGYHFWLHVQTCSLTITKEDGADGEPYVFTVMKNGVKYTEVTITGNDSVTIYELPVGNYTIQEDTGWSWRYTPNYNFSKAELSAGNSTGSITCTNTLEKKYWLNGFSEVVCNIFGDKH